MGDVTYNLTEAEIFSIFGKVLASKITFSGRATEKIKRKFIEDAHRVCHVSPARIDGECVDCCH